jgi:uncharacterized protein DUF3291
MPHGSHLAQLNVGRLLAPVESEAIAGFVAQLDPINRLADASPGFVWRLQTDEGNATAFRVLGDDTMLVNMSVWESLEALGDYVYRSHHARVMRRRREWFEHLREAYVALWWIEAGTIPTLADAEERIVHLREHGPTPFAFTFRKPFPPTPEDEKPPVGEAWLCPA